MVDGNGEKQDQITCDSCGWVVKVGEVYAEDKNGEILCEHCLDQSGLEGVAH